jgi:hypothetical protein
MVVVRYIAVVLLFTICGHWSAAHLLSSPEGSSPNGPLSMILLAGLPFALLCALLFLHTMQVSFAVPLIVAVWLISFTAADFLGADFTEISPWPRCNRPSADYRLRLG